MAQLATISKSDCLKSEVKAVQKIENSKNEFTINANLMIAPKLQLQ